MAKFKRREHKCKLEFGKLTYEVDIADKDLINKAIDFSNSMSEAAEKTDEEVVKEMEEIIDVLLGDGSLDDIKKEVYGKEEVRYWDILDITHYLLNEIVAFKNKTIESYSVVGK